MLLSPVPSSWSVHSAASRHASASLHLALRSSGSVLPRCKENAAGTEENPGPGSSKQPAPFSRQLSPGTLAPALLCPTGVSGSQVAPFSSQPTRARRCQLARQRAENPVPTSARVGRGDDWGEGGGGRLGRSASTPCFLRRHGGSEASQALPMPGRSDSPGCAPEPREIAFPGCGAPEAAAALARSAAGRCSLG
jgi:hypothetical protein